MFRTGPFLRSQALGVEPDLLTLGKGVSDMMFPFSVTLYSNRVQQSLNSIQSSVPDLLRGRFDYEFGYKTLINVLDRAEEANVSEQVRDRGALIEQLLSQGLSSCKAVRSVRVFGLLMGIELETKNWPWRWFRKQCGSLYVLNLLRHEPFPVLAGFCQYEPHVLKLTPPLSITREEVERMCNTLTDVLRQPPQRLVPALWEALIQVPIKEKLTAYWNRNLEHEHEYVTR
jgi:4-aminobutyrate aminotransferase-like enzyme